MLAAVAAILLLGMAVILTVPTGSAQLSDPCAQADARLAATGRGDRDRDGLSTCIEKRVLGTDHQDWDSDDDTVPDGDEVAGDTDPTDADTDDDGRDDGEEEDLGTDPRDDDSDGDGTPDGNDCTPRHELELKVEGPLAAITCPFADADGSLTIGGIGVTIALRLGTEFDGAESCVDLADRFTANGGAFVKVRVEEDEPTGLAASEVVLEDADHDRCPDETDDDDDDDGVADDEDEDDDDDGVSDDEDGDGHAAPECGGAEAPECHGNCPDEQDCVAAGEICTCVGDGCPDDDHDGHGDAACGGTDCDDHDDAVNPTAAEVCDDEDDNDCDAATNCEDSDCAGTVACP